MKARCAVLAMLMFAGCAVGVAQTNAPPNARTHLAAPDFSAFKPLRVVNGVTNDLTPLFTWQRFVNHQDQALERAKAGARESTPGRKEYQQLMRSVLEWRGAHPRPALTWRFTTVRKELQADGLIFGRDLDDNTNCVVTNFNKLVLTNTICSEWMKSVDTTTRPIPGLGPRTVIVYDCGFPFSDQR